MQFMLFNGFYSLMLYQKPSKKLIKGGKESLLGLSEYFDCLSNFIFGCLESKEIRFLVVFF